MAEGKNWDSTLVRQWLGRADAIWPLWELPATLAELVPSYLPTVPRDYFDGQPIRYSREFRAVWSVGRDNFKVASATMEEVDSTEIYLPLDFAAPSPNPRPAPAATTP